jgi:hypothetical protein
MKSFDEASKDGERLCELPLFGEEHPIVVDTCYRTALTDFPEVLLHLLVYLALCHNYIEIVECSHIVSVVLEVLFEYVFGLCLLAHRHEQVRVVDHGTREIRIQFEGLLVILGGLEVIVQLLVAHSQVEVHSIVVDFVCIDKRLVVVDRLAKLLHLVESGGHVE